MVENVDLRWPEILGSLGGQSGRIILEKDWSATSAGPIEMWNLNLRTHVLATLEAQDDRILYWGDDYTILCNDSASLLFRDGFGAIGKSLFDLEVSEQKDALPFLDLVKSTGRCYTKRNQLFVFHDQGHRFEAYVSFTFSAIRDLDLKTVAYAFQGSRATENVIAIRQWKILTELSSVPLSPLPEAIQGYFSVLGEYRSTFPFAAFYRLDKADALILEQTLGIRLPKGETYQLDTNRSEGKDNDKGEGDFWGLAQLSAENPARLLSDLPDFPLYENEHTNLFGLPREAYIQAIFDGQNFDKPVAYLILGLAPGRVFDMDYQNFLELTLKQFSRSIQIAKSRATAHTLGRVQSEGDRLKSKIYENLSEGIKAPLTRLLGSLDEYLDEGPEGHGKKEGRIHIETARKNSFKLLKLIDDLLDLSRFDTTRSHSIFEKTDLSRLTQDLCTFMKPTFEALGIQLKVETQLLPVEAYVDQNHWEKIVFHLLSNALNFTYEGEVLVRLFAEGTEILLEVEDTGMGIPEEQWPHLFERFHEVPTIEGRTKEGLGVSLALTQELVDIHGGTIRVTSAMNKGSTFTVQLPSGFAHLPQDRIFAPKKEVYRAHNSLAYLQSLWPLGEVSKAKTKEFVSERHRRFALVDGRAPRVLLLNVDREQAEFLKTALEPEYVLMEARSTEHAESIVKAYSPDLILGEWKVLESLEPEVLLRLRRSSENLKIPLLLLSSSSSQDEHEGKPNFEFDDYVDKPFHLSELRARMEGQLKLSELRKEIRSPTSRSLLALVKKDGVEGPERLAPKTWGRLTLAGKIDSRKSEETFGEVVEFKHGNKIGSEIRDEGDETFFEREGIAENDEDESNDFLMGSLLPSIQMSVEAESKIIENILDISRIAAGKLDLNKRELDLSELVRSAVKSVRHAADQKGITIIERAELPKAKTLGDEFRLKQALINILTNSIKFTKEGGDGEIIVSLKNKADRVEISIKDNGKGVEKNFLPHMFGTFTQAQAENALQKEPDGLGLGLSIVKHVIEAHDGRVFAESEGLDQGTTVTISLKAIRLTQVVRESYPGIVGQTAQKPLAGLNILVVEDIEDSRYLVCKMLSREGANIIEASSAEEAFSKMIVKPDLLVSDIGLPLENGIELIQRIRRLPSDHGGSIPAVAVTAWAREKDKKDALKAGFQRHIPKPIHSQKLIKAVLELSGRDNGDPDSKP